MTTDQRRVFDSFLVNFAAKLRATPGDLQPAQVEYTIQIATAMFNATIGVQQREDEEHDRKLATHYARWFRESEFRNRVFHAAQVASVELLLAKVVDSAAFRDELYKLTQNDHDVQIGLESYRASRS